jgi:outer membrane protein
MRWISLVLAAAGLGRAASDSLSLEDCLRLAHENNPRGFVPANAVESADLAREELRAQNLPQLKYRGTLEYSPSSKHLGYDPALTNGGQIGSQLVVEQSLYDGGKRGLARRKAELESIRARKEVQLGGLDLVFEVSQAFTEVLRLQDESALKRAGQARLRDYLGLVERMHTGGQAGYTDVLKSRIQVSEAEAAARRTEVELRTARFSLAGLIGKPIEDEVAAKGALDSASAPASLDTSANAEWDLGRLDLRGAQLDVDASRGEWKPTLAASVDAGLLTSFENLDQPSSDRSPMLGASAGLHLDWPLFAWGLRRIHIRQQQLGAESAKWRWQMQRRALLTDYQKTWLLWSAAGEHRDALRSNLSAARDNFMLTKSKYAAGNGLASEVLDAERLWMDTESSLLQAEADLRDLAAKLDRLKGH